VSIAYCRRASWIALALLFGAAAACADDVITTREHRFSVETVAEGLEHPWGMAFLPDGAILVTERPGRLRIVQGGRLAEEAVSGLPPVEERGQGGLFGIALHPWFPENGLVYLALAARGEGGYSTEVIRGRLDGMQLEEVETVFRAQPKTRESRHFGGRLVFDREGLLYVSLGDRGEQDYAQDLSDHRGTLVRIRDDGTVPQDNPFIGREGARPEIFTYGNRNMQGMIVHPGSGLVWTHEHGPQGGDEVNIMRPGVNYGWPVITYGVNYGLGTRIGEGTHKEGMAQPVYKWVPSIAPSGMALYTGDRFPAWQGDLFVGSLKFGLLVRLELDGERVVGEERMLDGEYGRIRDVVQGPDGLLYLLTDESDGRLLRLVPR
jgi:glucose/arabinose dehydrogenase